MMHQIQKNVPSVFSVGNGHVLPPAFWNAVRFLRQLTRADTVCPCQLTLSSYHIFFGSASISGLHFMKSPFFRVIIFVFVVNVFKTRKQGLCNIYKTSTIVINAIDSFEKSV